ncbi:MAG TPA: glycosyltransferase family 4 protein [Blastocatellia bacterium]|nr:glycosyltransferase family 4 protein [Blastocatellia bacterium]
MKIGMLAPLWERVPPEKYGGTELVVYNLTEELVRRGHDVTLFASGDSITSAKLHSIRLRSLRAHPDQLNPNCYTMLHSAECFRNADQFDLIHNHTGWNSVPMSSMVDTPTVTTLHDRVNKEGALIFRTYQDHNVISISDSYRKCAPNLNYLATVYNGIDVDGFPFQEKPADQPYLAFLGRFSFEKAPHLAIKVAKATGSRLKIGAKLPDNPNDEKYYKEMIEPQVDGDQIQYVGELGFEQKVELLANAQALLFPIQWDEPFGLVSVEALACGTPVIACARGAVTEILEEGKVGFLCKDENDLINAVSRIDKIDRAICRSYVEERFDVTAMTDGYLKAYSKILKQPVVQVA